MKNKSSHHDDITKPHDAGVNDATDNTLPPGDDHQLKDQAPATQQALDPGTSITPPPGPPEPETPNGGTSTTPSKSEAPNADSESSDTSDDSSLPSPAAERETSSDLPSAASPALDPGNPSPQPAQCSTPVPKLAPTQYVIPEDINDRSLLDAARYYHEKLGWAVHPLSPSDKGPDGERGKKPVNRGWKKHTAGDIEPGYLEKHFGPGSTHNLGCVVRGTFVHIDLDSKPDAGASVRAWLATKPELAQVPRELTGGGAHLLFVCMDIPDSVLKNKSTLTAQINDAVSAELYCDGLNIVLSPSTHKNGHKYKWEVTGAIPEVRWEDLCRWFGFATPTSKGPGRPRKAPPWFADYPEDLATFDLKEAMSELKMLGKCLDRKAHKYAVKCPWSELHTSGLTGTSGTDTAIYNTPETMPGFKCFHAHCSDRTIGDLVKYLEEVSPGVVARLCTRHRVHLPGAVNEGKVRIVLPVNGRSQSKFSTELGKVFAQAHCLFRFAGKVVEVASDSVGGIRSSRLSILEPKGFVTAVEHTVEIGILRDDEAGGKIFIPTSMTEAVARIALASSHLLDHLPEIKRVLDVAIPFPADDGSLVYPTSGFDERFGTWLDPNAPEIKAMSLANARALLNELFCGPEDGGFWWKNEQARTHAIARLISPFCRGLMNFKRSPISIFDGNREGVGKDTCAALTPILYTGRACTGAPLSKDSEDEMRKRITSELMAAERFAHFANMKGNICYPSLEAATDNSGLWKDRKLGGNKAPTLVNECDFSFSANNATWTPDIGRRSRQIALCCGIEDISSHQYRHTDILGLVRANRSSLLSAVAALVAHWDQQGRPAGPTFFTSFPEWGRVVGGVMTSCGYPDPCLPHEANFQSGDQSTATMAAFFNHAFEHFGSSQVSKVDFQNFIKVDSETHDFFDSTDFTTRGGLVSFSKHLFRYTGRELGGITFTYSPTSKNRGIYRFVRSHSEKTPPSPPTPLVADASSDSMSKNAPSQGDMGVGGVSSAGSSDEIYSKDLPVSNSINFHHDQKGTNNSLYSPSPQSSQTFRRCEDLEEINVMLLNAHLSKAPVTLQAITKAPSNNRNFDPRSDEVQQLVLQPEGGSTWIIDLPALNFDLSNIKTWLELMTVIVHGAKDMMLWLRSTHDIHIRNVSCTQTAAHLLRNGGDDSNDLHHRIKKYLTDDDKADSWVTIVLPGTPTTPQPAVNSKRLHDLHQMIAAEVERNGLTATWDLENRLLPVVVAMEGTGFHIQRERLTALVSKDIAGAAGLMEHLDADDRIRAIYNPLGVATGRFSTTGPNVQGTPRGEIRTAFNAPAGRCLVKADYSQIEMRVLAAITNDTQLLKAFQSGEDPHRTMAAAILEKPLSEVTDEDRQIAKAINFGIINGQGSNGMVRTAKEMFDLDLSETTASGLRESFYRAYPRVNRRRIDCKSQSKKEDLAEVRTLIGRRRLVPTEADDYERLKNLLSTPVQGGAADGIKRAMIQAFAKLPKDAMIVAMIHDELIVECPTDQAEAVKEILIRSMTNGMNSIYPNVLIEVKACICDTWADK